MIGVLLGAAIMGQLGMYLVCSQVFYKLVIRFFWKGQNCQESIKWWMATVTVIDRHSWKNVLLNNHCPCPSEIREHDLKQFKTVCSWNTELWGYMKMKNGYTLSWFRLSQLVPNFISPQSQLFYMWCVAQFGTIRTILKRRKMPMEKCYF